MPGARRVTLVGGSHAGEVCHIIHGSTVRTTGDLYMISNNTTIDGRHMAIPVGTTPQQALIQLLNTYEERRKP